MSTLAIVRWTPPRDIDALILAYWLMYLRTPARQEPDVDGCYELGAVGELTELEWSRVTPYSVARVGARSVLPARIIEND